MKAGGSSSRKRKSAALENTYKALAPVAIEAPVPPRPRVGGAADRLSSLPNAVLEEIISLLNTKEGARTRILASRWRDLWLSAPLNLDYHDLIADVERSVCSAIISRILSSHHGPGRRLRVNIYILNVPDDTVEAWLRSDALDNLEELNFIDPRLEQPQQALIFRFSRTLRVANISGCNLSDFTLQGLHFPLLQQLGLVNVTISECSLHTLIAGCPALECLLIYKTIGVRCLRINSLTIRSVSVLSREKCYYLALNPRIRLEQVVIENAPHLLRLLHLDPQDGLHVSVVAATKLETLGFIGDTGDSGESSTLVFGSTVIQELRVDKLITEGHTVKILALDMHNLSLDTVIALMRCFPCVQKLYIKSYESRLGNLWRRKHRNLIRCLDLRLKKIVLTNYRGLKSQVNFVMFFALNANLLESVTLGIKDGNNNEEFLAEQRMKLQIENSASKDVRLHFTTDYGSHYLVSSRSDHCPDLVSLRKLVLTMRKNTSGQKCEVLRLQFVMVDEKVSIFRKYMHIICSFLRSDHQCEAWFRRWSKFQEIIHAPISLLLHAYKLRSLQNLFDYVLDKSLLPDVVGIIS